MPILTVDAQYALEIHPCAGGDHAALDFLFLSGGGTNLGIRPDVGMPRVMVPMRDGVELATDIYVPENQFEGPYPVLIERTPYNKRGCEHLHARYFVKRGYVVLIQDERGRYNSEGTNYWLRDEGWGERQDGHDTIEWAAKQSWSNGKVGTMGLSFTCANQYLTMVTKPPHLEAMFCAHATPCRRLAATSSCSRTERGITALPGRGASPIRRALTSPVEVTGLPKLEFYASSSAVDTDWVVTITDVQPDGCSQTLRQNILRARYREGDEAPVFMKRGEIYPFGIEMYPISNLFLQGHRIRIVLSSSSFPKWYPNGNTGKEMDEDFPGVVAKNSIYHDREHPSKLVLPVIPRGATTN